MHFDYSILNGTSGNLEAMLQAAGSAHHPAVYACCSVQGLHTFQQCMPAVSHAATSTPEDGLTDKDCYPHIANCG